MKNIAVGDVVEIELSNGFMYAQYTHRHAQYGYLMRVFESVYDQRPSDWKAVCSDMVRFSFFFPLSAAVNKKIVCVVGNAVVSDQNKNFPIFRSGIVDPKTRKVSTWWFWDGDNSWMVGDIDDEQRKMPIRGVWNDTLLIKRLEEGWTPEKDLT